MADHAGQHRDCAGVYHPGKGNDRVGLPGRPERFHARTRGSRLSRSVPVIAALFITSWHSSSRTRRTFRTTSSSGIRRSVTTVVSRRGSHFRAQSVSPPQAKRSAPPCSEARWPLYMCRASHHRTIACMARKLIPANSDLVLQVHYQAIGEPVTEVTKSASPSPRIIPEDGF